MIKRLIKRILTDISDVKFIAVLSAAMLIVAMIPLLVIGRYAHPCADDFGYGYLTHAFWQETHSLSQTLHWAVVQVKESYDTWQGTFSSIFLMALTPAIWGENYYFLTPIIMLSGILFSYFYLLYVILVKGINADKYSWCIVSSIVCFLMIETIVSPVNAFFWYNGAVHYIFMNSCMVCLIGAVLHMDFVAKLKSKLILTVFAVILSVACGGSNYSTALLGIVILAVILFFKILKKKDMWMLMPLGVYIISFFKSVTAYGNVIRQSNFEKKQPVEAVLKSFLLAGRDMRHWISLPVVLFVLFLAPILWKMVSQCSFKFRCPIIVTIMSYCLISCMYTPALYALGGEAPLRLSNIIKMWFLFLLVFNVGYWMGFVEKSNARIANWSIPINTKLYAVAIVMIACICIKIFSNSILNYSSYAAYVSLRAGEAYQYHTEYMQRLEVLESDDKEVCINDFTVKPYLLFFDDITEDRYDWRNQTMARWYQKDMIIKKSVR